jgi:cysteinyl-tRNA synthetase
VFRLYDTRTRRAEEIRPAGGRVLRMFSCGPGPDRPAHAGDLRPYLLADLIRRNAEHRHQVTVMACRNVADAGQAPGDGAPGNEDAFRSDCLALNLRPAELSPRASDDVGLITGMISKLIDAGHAYLAEGSAYFEARSFPGYGGLSGGPGEPPPGEPPADWALWTGAAAGWPAPWGPGFAARSAACSAQSVYYLGDVIDLHTGGTDVRFRHDEQERAQSDSAAGHEVVRHWVHGERLLFDGREMTGPGGHAVLVSDLDGRGLDPLALRLAFLEHHYRQPASLTWDALAAADAELRRWRHLVARWADSPSKPMCAEVTGQIAAAFDDDLDTPAALRALRSLDGDQQIPPGSKFETFAHTDQLLGLDLARDVGRI